MHENLNDRQRSEQTHRHGPDNAGRRLDRADSAGYGGKRLVDRASDHGDKASHRKFDALNGETVRAL